MERVKQLQQARVRAKEAGFTLVELAIVLVIIGLIIGGVLVGQDLIKAAEVRSTVAQLEGYNAAVNTFRSKYNSIPGDIRNAQDFFDVGVWTELENGNGNRRLEVCDGAVAGDSTCTAFEAVGAGTTHSGEALQFWHHLSAAELVGGYYNGLPGDGSNGGGIETSFPRSNMDRNGVGVFADGGRNYFQIGIIEDAAMAYVVDGSLTPQESFDLDGKIDDGRPGTGAVVARSAVTGTPANAPIVAADTDFDNGTLTACINEAGTSAVALRDASYALLNEDIVCTLRFRMN